MTESLESAVENSKQLSLGQELAHSIKKYPETWKDYFKSLAPALVVSSITSAVGQWAAMKLGYDSTAAMTAAAYVCGYIPGYATFFGLEYFRNKSKYPSGVLSKEFGEFVGTFMAADYVADLSTFTPAFIASNFWLANNTELHPAIRGIVAWDAASLLYISSISAIHPITRRINQSINTKIKSLYSRLVSKDNKNVTGC